VFNILEATRSYITNIPFVQMSTNKVYGDGPYEIPMVELKSRWDYLDEKYKNGISENFRIDQNKLSGSSLFPVGRGGLTGVIDRHHSLAATHPSSNKNSEKP